MMAQFADRVQRSFSRSFASYHDAASQQARIADRLVQELHQCGVPGHFASVLELGCGTGLLTERLLAEFDCAALSLNDLSPEARQTADRARAQFLQGDAAQIDWPQKPDLIVSSSMIQWLPDPAAFLQRAAYALAPGGWLALSGFGPEQYRELVQIGSSAKAPGLRTARDLAGALPEDMEILSSGEAIQQVHFPSPRHVLEHLRRTGVNGRAQKPWSKSRLTRFSQDYIRLFQNEAGLPLTYHAVWIIARKRG